MLKILSREKCENFSRQEILFICAILVSTCGDVLIPTAFALEGLRVDPGGAGFTAILLTLWFGRFVGTFLFKNFRQLNLKHSMIAADIVRFFAQTVLFFWIILVDNSITAMVISSFVYGLATSFFLPSRFAITPEIVPKERIKNFNSFINLISDSLMVISPAIATILFSLTGFTSIIVFDSITFLLGIVFLSFIKVDGHEAGNYKNNEEDSKYTAYSIPSWALWGLFLWSFITLSIGYSGASGPYFIINNFGMSEWMIVSTSLAIGSIAGSTAQLIGIFQRFSWRSLQVLAGILISVQILSFATNDSIVLIAISAFSASLIMTSAGISWDTKIQQSLSGSSLRSFANLESFLTTGTIPLGMIFFGASSLLEIQTLMSVLIALICIITIIPFFIISKNKTESSINV